MVMARSPVENVSQRRSVADFFSGYQRWSVLQRALVGRALHGAQGLLNPTLLAASAAGLDPCPRKLAALVAVAGPARSTTIVAPSSCADGAMASPPPPRR
jgi:ceramide glucosyltransferase